MPPHRRFAALLANDGSHLKCEHCPWCCLVPGLAAGYRDDVEGCGEVERSVGVRGRLVETVEVHQVDSSVDETAVIAGYEAAWTFFGGAFKVLIPDNLKPVVTDADAVNPTLSVGWLDYAQHVGFGTDPARSPGLACAQFAPDTT